MSDPHAVYLNHAGTSWPKAPGVVDAVQRAMLADPRGNAELYRVAHAAVARFFGIDSPDRLLLAPACTSALAVALGDLELGCGDAVLTSQLEHHALVRPIQKLALDRGVRHVLAPYRPGEPIDLEFVERELRAGAVRLVAVTGASNVTGERLPVEALVRLAHAHDALVLLDAAQLAGLVDVDVRTLGVDLMAFAAHKAMRAPFGVGGLWAAPHVRFRCPTAVCEIGGDGGRRGTGTFPGFCDMGSVDFPALAGVAAAIDWLEARTDEQRQRPLRLADRLRRELLVRGDCRVLGAGPDRGVRYTATVSLLPDRLPLADAQRHFREHGDLVVRAGQHCAPLALEALDAREGCLRISFGPDNDDADVDRVLAALDASP